MTADTQTVAGHFTRFERMMRIQLLNDPRLVNGAPKNLRGDDLTFIRLTGMTRPAAVEAAAPPASALTECTAYVSAAARGFREIILMLGGTPAEDRRLDRRAE